MPVEPNLTSSVATDESVRELQVVGEIAEAFLTSDSPVQVYELALERVTPLVGASFASIFLREPESELLHVVAAYNWPVEHSEHLEEMRVRIGNGPTGRAVQDNALIEVSDIFAAEELRDWWDAARELGFSSSIALPLASEVMPVGALTFYFREAQNFRDADRELLRLVADQLAATAEKAYLIENLQRVNDQLREQNVELEARYREAEEARRFKNEFLANVSHELRTPLTAILGYAYLLKEGVHGPMGTEQSGAVDKIEDAGIQLVGLVDALLDLTNLRLNKLSTELELCDAVVLARAAMGSVPPPVGGVALELVAPQSRLPIHTDPVLVQRILSSLISNAVKFTETGSVRVYVQEIEPDPAPGQHYRRGSNIVWAVRDTGIGIHPDDRDIIFEDFRQGDGSATRRFGGAGLGLAVARGLAQRLGGDISLESAPGEGSTFMFCLPSSVVRAGG